MLLLVFEKLCFCDLSAELGDLTRRSVTQPTKGATEYPAIAGCVTRRFRKTTGD
jgi:hypothetical protein